QLLIFAPGSLAILDVATGGSRSFWRLVSQPLRNPIIIGSMLGVLVSLSGIEIAEPAMGPFRLVGAGAVPLMLLNYGIALKGRKVLEAGTARRDVVLASALKLAAMPLIAWALGAFAFGLDGHQLFIVTALAALPTAQ